MSEQLIKQRKSYKEWKRFYEFIRDMPAKEVLVEIYRIMDQRRCFGSATNADYVQESIELILKEV